MGLTTRRNVNLAVPRAQDRNREMRGSAETKESNAVARLDVGYAQAAESDNARAEQWGRMQIVEHIRKRKNKVRASEGVFRVSAGNGVAGKGWRVAEILHALLAVGTGIISSPEPGDADA